MRVASGKRLAGHNIERSDYVEAKVRVYSQVEVIVASVSNSDSQVSGSMLPDLVRREANHYEQTRHAVQGGEAPPGQRGTGML